MTPVPHTAWISNIEAPCVMINKVVNFKLSELIREVLYSACHERGTC